MPSRAPGFRYRVEPRDVPPVIAARRLGLSLASFQAVLKRLIGRGFPAPDPDTGHFDLKAVEAWMDSRSGLATDADLGRDAASVKSRLDGWDGGGRRSGR